jgi:hypothetical protein
MVPIKFKEANAKLLPPIGQEDKVGVLDVFKENLPNAGPVIISAWKPDQIEIKRILAGGPIYFICYGSNTHPPISLTAHKIFADEPGTKTG